MDYQDLFRTRTNRVMLVYKAKNTAISLHAETYQPSEPPPIEEWFELVDTSRHAAGIEEPQRTCIRINALSNLIAAKTRRGTANILIVQNSEMLDLVLKNRPFPDWFEQVHIDKNMQHNEVRVAYWRDGTGMFDALDGGVQFSPDGFVRLGDDSAFPWTNYFMRTLI